MAGVTDAPPALHQIDAIPADIAGIGPRELHEILPGPTLIRLAGERPEPLFISTLLHGNETTSFEVLQHLQRAFEAHRPLRSLLIFIGNVAAAAQGKRFLDGQPDFNRIWAHGTGPWHSLAEQVLAIARQEGVFASIDIHNNTGDNPIYGCVNALRPADLHLAETFAPLGVFYLNPATTQSIAFSRLCPSITVECGQSGNAAGRKAAIRLVEHAMRLSAFPKAPPQQEKLQLYETVGRVLVDPATPLRFGGTGPGLSLPADLERCNFTYLAAGTVFGELAEWAGCPLTVCDEHDSDLTGEFLRLDGRTIRLTQAVTPAMITTNTDVIRQDCLCYLMKPI